MNRVTRPDRIGGGSLQIYIERAPLMDKWQLWSCHRSSTAAEREFAYIICQMPETRVYLIDVTTGERKQYDGREVVGPFVAEVSAGWAS